MKDTHDEKVETIHYIITFACFAAILICFATPLFTGKPALIQFDSLAGSLLLGVIFLVYSGWFVYSDMVNQNMPVSEALLFNIKKNATFICVALYWLILIIVPFMANII